MDKKAADDRAGVQRGEAAQAPLRTAEEGDRDFTIPVIHHCPEYLVIDKPYDLRLDGKHNHTVEKQVPIDVSLPPGQKLRWCHQLDYATSGVLCIALTKQGN